MESCDPESEALIWQLHRELNGLTRSSRRGTALVSLDSQKKDTRPNASRRPKATVPSNLQEQRSEQPKRKNLAPSEEPGEQPAAKATKVEPTDSPALKPITQKQPPPPPPTTQQPPADVAPAVKEEPTTAQFRQEPAHRDSPPGPHPTPLTHHISPIVAAAISAGQQVREQAKSKAVDDTGQRVIKCFYAGIRWGIPLKPADLQSRAELATALNDALAGEILSCGRGDILHIVFLRSDGSITEFPSLRSAGTSTKESLQKWQVAVEQAVKVYVRRT